MTAASAPLSGLRIVEFASFVAGPSAGVTFAQLGAEVIRIDPLGGAADIGRWPVSRRTGASLYWTALNRGKRSVAIDVRDPEGRELVLGLATAPGPDEGIVVDNIVGRPWFSYESLRDRRSDVIHARVEGSADGRAAVDYTVNPACGVAELTGPADSDRPVNHVLPAWDLVTGMTATTAVLAAVRRRALTGEGSRLQIALDDVALATVANLGWLSEVAEVGDRERHGNHMYGTFGVDFVTRDGERVMVVALTGRQWSALCAATGTEEVMAALGRSLSADLSAEADRYRHREVVEAVLRPWFSQRPFPEVQTALDAAGALWSRYRSLRQVVDDFRAEGADVLVEMDQPGVGQVISARSPIRVDDRYGEPAVASELGADTDGVLADVLGLDDHELARLHDSGVLGTR
ncbi:CoA transferase [uncultured Williamsia sp.]|uniref:CoA transferase n=1 Tax=uncultured Williamsia sp. TaxID=259311 RepID=UPI00260FC3A3|nr:CoA transferase [uncultured Williamsia sp.]